MGAPTWPPSPQRSGRPGQAVTPLDHGGPDMAPKPPTLGAPRPSRDAPRLRAAGDLGEQEYLAVGADRLEQRVLVDLAVDGHGNTFVEVTLEGRVQLDELTEEVPHGRRREVELGDAPRELREVADQHHPSHASGLAGEAALLERLEHLGR
jgi:hypothetical protein